MGVPIATAGPAWPLTSIHEFSPADRGISKKLASERLAHWPPRYTLPGVSAKTSKVFGTRTPEHQTFANASPDLVVTQGVMEHVLHPGQVCREVARTLRPNGHYIFSTPTYQD